MDGCSPVVVTAVDGGVAPVVDRPPTPYNAEEGSSCPPILSGGSSGNESHPLDGMPAVREGFRERGISAEGADILMASWKPGTGKQYRPHIRRWSEFCDRWRVNSFTPGISHVVNFLSETFHRNVGYEAVNTARSALSSLGIVVAGCRVGTHPLVVRFMKGVFNLRPPLPRYTETWDTQPVLNALQSMYPLHSLSLKDLTLKLVMLMALTQAARVQTLHFLILDGLCFEPGFTTLALGGNIKQCRPGFNVRSVRFQAYPKDIRLCVCETLRHYITRTEDLRQGTSQDRTSLLISFIKPHRAVSRDTVARWVKCMLNRSGVDTTKFSAGSVRPAAASKAKALSVPISCIMAKAGWSQESTFAKFYDKTIIRPVDQFQEAVLQCE